MALVSSRIRRADRAFASVRDFYFASRYTDRRADPEISDFTFGNPHEMPLEGLVSALRKHAIPENKDWFAYKTSDVDACEIVAESLGKELGLIFDPADIAMTTGAFGAIAVALRLLLDAGDEAIFSAVGQLAAEPTRKAS